MKRIVSWLENTNIQSKFTICVAVCILLPLCLLFTMIEFGIVNVMERQNFQTQLEILKQTSPAVEFVVKDVESFSLSLVMDNYIQKYLRTISTSENNNSKEKVKAGNIMSESLRYRDYITHMSFFDGEHIFLQIGSDLRAFEKTLDLEHVRRMHGEPVWYPAAIEPGYFQNEHRIPEVQMIRNINDLSAYTNVLAFVQICISEEEFTNLYSNIAGDSTRHLLIAQEDGVVVSSLDKSLLGTNVSTESWFPKQSEDGWKKQGRLLVCHCRIAGTDWQIIWTQNVNWFDFSGLILMLFILSVALICIFVLVFMRLQRKTLIQPIQYLSADVAAFQNETMSIGIYRDTQDEVGRLNRGISDMAQRIHTLIEDGYKSQLREKKAQLQALQMQINPHFLYNTLESIRWMAYREKMPEIARQIEALSRLFRHVLNSGSDETDIAGEVEHVNDYVLLQKNKYGERLIYNCEVEPGLLKQKTLTLILQPVVENSIVHGFENKLDECRVDVRIFREGNTIIYRVSDNGVGTNEEEIRRQINDPDISTDSFALSNIQKRIMYRYGNAYGLEFQSGANRGTVVTIRIPYGG